MQSYRNVFYPSKRARNIPYLVPNDLTTQRHVYVLHRMSKQGSPQRKRVRSALRSHSCKRKVNR
ncbi:hypothetical protein PsorP6_010146 [Peronosclerospora sorghi]|uniref:Uncharacterized protein n=1 Tax=Peronosclerospora sorghi TaxID=230839 RepID=A0ACC0VZ41_9STRA|nr:hypothetical protein PsorP6_010146 [Peronosclerospora sorghi]